MKTKTPARMFAFVGGDSETIGVYHFDPESGRLRPASELKVPSARPTFLSFNSGHTVLFAANETDGGGVLSFAIDPQSAALTQLNESPMQGSGPTHVQVDKTNRWLLAASYNSGRVASFPIHPNGRLGDMSDSRYAGEKAHQIIVAPQSRATFVPCLGSNLIAQFSFAADSGQIQPHEAGPLSVSSGGPRHMAFHPNGKWAYVLQELDSTLQALRFENGQLQLQGKPLSTLTSPVPGNSGAEVQVHPSGKFVFTSNRGDDSIALFTVGDQGRLNFEKTFTTGGKTPRHFSIDPSGRWLLVANQQSNDLRVLAIDTNSGELSSPGEPLAFGSPQFIQVLDLAVNGSHSLQ